MNSTALVTLITELNVQVVEGVVFGIDAQSVSKAKAFLRAENYRTIEDLVAALCSLNLLNAAIKIQSFKEMLGYGFIKSHAASLIGKIDALKISSITYFYDSKERCLYYKIGDVIFSFHHVPLTPSILKASLNQPIKWGGIRLQKIAQPLFDYMHNIVS